VVHVLHQRRVKRKPDELPVIIGITDVPDVGLGSRVNAGLTLPVMFADGAVTILS